jgi:outer membrane biosynthesis protein TonB
MLPAASSPAVDAGSTGETLDQRGLARPADQPGIANSTALGADGADMGAVELSAPPVIPPVTPPVPQPTPKPKAKKKCKKPKKKTPAAKKKFKKCKKKLRRRA